MSKNINNSDNNKNDNNKKNVQNCILLNVNNFIQVSKNRNK